MIIDGRIADVCETGFLDGTLVIPQFVLKELQLVADSSDSLKRNRGRRGLDILQKIQKMSGVDVTISDIDFPEVREVDLKLIELGRTLQGKIVTNDFNLNKVAQLRGVAVLNINELANALKPVVLPGEFMKVFILKEGKEYNQGVAYLDDGTMVVVDNARRMINKNIDVVVTSVLQTTAGKMIFGRYIEGTPQVAPPQVAAAARPRRRRSEVRRLPPFHWWRTVFYLIPAVTLYTIALGTASVVSSLFDSHRALRPPVRARVVVAHPQDDGRARHGLRPRAGSIPRAATCSPPITRASTTSRSSSRRCRTSSASSPRTRSAGFRFSGWHLQRTGHLLVDRSKPGAAVVKKMARLVGERHSLIVFPEGTRSVDGTVGRFKGGSFLLALEAGVPVVPISIAGSRHVMMKGQLMVCPAEVAVIVHAPVETAAVARDGVRDLSKTVQARVVADVT